jgi:hypothetical protein
VANSRGIRGGVAATTKGLALASEEQRSLVRIRLGSPILYESVERSRYGTSMDGSACLQIMTFFSCRKGRGQSVSRCSGICRSWATSQFSDGGRRCTVTLKAGLQRVFRKNRPFLPPVRPRSLEMRTSSTGLDHKTRSPQRPYGWLRQACSRERWFCKTVSWRRHRDRTIRRSGCDRTFVFDFCVVELVSLWRPVVRVKPSCSDTVAGWMSRYSRRSGNGTLDGFWRR